MWHKNLVMKSVVPRKNYWFSSGLQVWMRQLLSSSIARPLIKQLLKWILVLPVLHLNSWWLSSSPSHLVWTFLAPLTFSTHSISDPKTWSEVIFNTFVCGKSRQLWRNFPWWKRVSLKDLHWVEHLSTPMVGWKKDNWKVHTCKLGTERSWERTFPFFMNGKHERDARWSKTRIFVCFISAMQASFPSCACWTTLHGCTKQTEGQGLNEGRRGSSNDLLAHVCSRQRKMQCISCWGHATGCRAIRTTGHPSSPKESTKRGNAFYEVPSRRDL